MLKPPAFQCSCCTHLHDKSCRSAGMVKHCTNFKHVVDARLEKIAQLQMRGVFRLIRPPDEEDADSGRRDFIIPLPLVQPASPRPA